MTQREHPGDYVCLTKGFWQFVLSVIVVISVLVWGSAVVLGVKSGEVTTINVDVTANRHGISQLVYCLNYATPQQLELLSSPVNFLGGAASACYNWRQNASNAGARSYFVSSRGIGVPPTGTIASWITPHRMGVIEFPIMGWVAQIGDDGSPRWSYSVRRYGDQRDVSQLLPDAGDGLMVSGAPISNNDPTDAMTRTEAEYSAGWLDQIREDERQGEYNILYFMLDNEPGLWHNDHPDVWPVGVRMADLYSREAAAARLIKDSLPGSLVAGPELGGWDSFFNSGYDIQWASKHGRVDPAPDRSIHVGMDIAPWLLRQFAKADKRDGRRLLDLFTLHFRPLAQGVASNDVSAEVKRLRNRSTRSLWDSRYKDDGSPGEPVRLIPRMKEWVSANYSNTPIGITDYDWGAENSMSGAVAEADVLGIMGRDGVSVAARHMLNGTESATFKAMQMYVNCDGNHGALFGNESVRCDGGNPDDLASYAACDGARKSVSIMIINKQSSHAAGVRIVLQHVITDDSVTEYQLTSQGGIRHMPDLPISHSVILSSVPPESVTLMLVQTRG